jgi:hypothetical protein
MRLKQILPAFFFVLSAMISVTGVYAQAWDWTAPEPASDSLADNHNAILEEVLYNGNYTYMLFWERSGIPGSTSIFCRDLYAMDEPFQVVNGDQFHCTNPRIINTYFYDDDTLFYLFYESDQNGNSDIYYIVYTLNGFTGPALFTGSDEDESHLRCNESGYMVWQEGDRIKSSQLYKYNSPFYFTEPVTIDNINCGVPDIDVGYNSYVAYLKQQNDSTYIFLNTWNGSWPESVRLSGADEIASLRFASGTCWDEGGVISWESIDNTIHTIHAMSLYGYNEYLSGFQQAMMAFSPAMAIYYIPVEDFYESGLLTFTYGTDTGNDVYMGNQEYYISPNIDDYFNLSNSLGFKINPVIFQGREVEYPWRDMYVIWEAYRSGYWQLFYSHKWMFCGGGIDEQQSTAISGLNIFPNPVKNTCDISYTLSERSYVSIQLCTPDGKQVTLMEKTMQEKGEQVYKLDFERMLPGNLFAGVYLIKVQAGNNIVSGKIIRVK